MDVSHEQFVIDSFNVTNQGTSSMEGGKLHSVLISLPSLQQINKTGTSSRIRSFMCLYICIPY